MAVDTSAASITPPGTLPARVLGHFRQPLERNGYALLLASLLNSVLGFAFWVMAARWYPAEAVGTATALVAAMTFLATLSTLGLRGGLLRFLPVAGAQTSRMVRRVYLACAATAAGAATIFVAGSAVWASELAVVRDEPLAAVAFVAVVVLWVIYVLQEHVLAGLGRAVVVPIVAGSYATVKLALLAALVGAAGWGVFAAFTTPALLAVGVVSVVVFARLAPRNHASLGDRTPSMGVLVRFAAGDHTATLLALIAVDLVPLLVLARLGPSASAYYYIAFTAAYVLFLVSSNMGSALVVEASRRPDRLAQLARRTLRNAGVLVGLAVAVGVVAARPLLSFLGEDYAENATTLMQLVLLSALPGVVVGVSNAVARAQSRTRVLVATNLALAVIVFGGGEIGLRTWGLPGVGVAWVVAETLLAIVLLATQLRFVLLGVGGPLLAVASRARGALRHPRRLALARRLLRSLDGAGDDPGSCSLFTSGSDMLVVATERAGRSVVVKLALTDRTAVALTLHTDAVDALRAREDLGSWRRLLPEILERGHVDGLPYVVESRLPGHVAASSEDRELAPPVAAIARAVAQLHDTTVRAAGHDVVHERIAATLTRLGRLPGSADRADSLRRLGAALTVATRASGDVDVAWVHGDCWLGNVLLTEDPGDPGTAARQPRVTGIVDWENASDQGLPDVDLAHLWLGTRGEEVGPSVRTALATDPEQFDRWLDRVGVRRAYRAVPARVAISIAWLEHVAGCVDRTSPTGTWTARTVDEVLPVALDALGDKAGASPAAPEVRAP